jgi:hypothetical protein
MTKTLSLCVHLRIYQARQRMLRSCDAFGVSGSKDGGETWSSMRIIGPITVCFTSPWIVKVRTSFLHSFVHLHSRYRRVYTYFKVWTNARKRSFSFWLANLLVFVDNNMMLPSNRHQNTRANSKKRNEVFTGTVRSENNVKRYEYIHQDSSKMEQGRVQIALSISRQYLQANNLRNSSASLLKVTVLCEC